MPKEDNIYCGIGPLPKGKRFGTMKECLDRNQVRRFGLYKIDTKLIEAVHRKQTKAKKEDVEDLTIKFVSLGGKIKRLKGQIQAEKNKKIKSELEKDLKILENQKNELGKKIKRLKD